MYMENSSFLLLILAGIGVFFVTDYVLKLVVRCIASVIEKRETFHAYQKAYELGSQFEVNVANTEFAYQKLAELATTKKNYRSRKADLNYVIELGIPSTIKLRNLLTAALPNQHEAEIIEMISSYLHQVNSALHESNHGGIKIDNSNKKESIEIRFSSYATAISLIFLEIASIIYLFSKLESLSVIQLFITVAFLVLATSVSLYNFWPKKKLLPLYFLASFLILLLLLHGYSNKFHGDNITTLINDSFDGNVSCPGWFRADEDCSAPLVITSHVQQEVNIEIQFDENNLFLKDGECKNFIGETFTLSQSTPISFRLQAKNSHVFDGSITKVVPMFLQSDGNLITQDSLTCEVILENQVWASFRKIVLMFISFSGVVSFIQLLITLKDHAKSPIKSDKG